MVKLHEKDAVTIIVGVYGTRATLLGVFGGFAFSFGLFLLLSREDLPSTVIGLGEVAFGAYLLWHMWKVNSKLNSLAKEVDEKWGQDSN